MNNEKRETLEEYLWKIGSEKESNISILTWDEIAEILNQAYDYSYDESVYRKKYKKLKKLTAATDISNVDETLSYSEVLKKNTYELEKRRILLKEQQNAQKRQIRTEAYLDDFWETLRKEIQKLPSIKTPECEKETDKEMIAMLSDIHYGLSFKALYHGYNVEIAEQRVMLYAERLCEIARKEGCSTIHVLLMGDLISGIIHQTIRLENRKNIIEQIVGVSNLITSFLLTLSKTFSKVTVSNVVGNHSRVDFDANNALREERLDALIPWFCEAKLSNIKHIIFEDSALDTTVGIKQIMGKTYAFVHGDFDPNLKTSAVKISNLTHRQIDYILAGHMHIADMRIEDIGYIRNGSVVTGGDDYTAKKRLFGPAVQVCLLVSKTGVEAVYPVKLS